MEPYRRVGRLGTLHLDVPLQHPHHDIRRHGAGELLCGTRQPYPTGALITDRGAAAHPRPARKREVTTYAQDTAVPRPQRE